MGTYCSSEGNPSRRASQKQIATVPKPEKKTDEPIRTDAEGGSHRATREGEGVQIAVEKEGTQKGTLEHEKQTPHDLVVLT